MSARMQRSLSLGLLICLLFVLVPLEKISAEGVSLEISIEGNQTATVLTGSEFAARIDITAVTGLAGYQLVIKYDPGIILVSEINPGKIGETAVPVEGCSLVPGDLSTQGEVLVFGHCSQLETNNSKELTGSGYLLEMQLQAIGTPGQSSEIELVYTELRDTGANLITHSADSSSTISIVRSPAITSVNTQKIDGAYKAGEIIDISIVFDRVVFVDTGDGIPGLHLNSGGEACYQSGSGTSSLVFRYLTASGQNCAALDYSSTDSLSLNGAYILDGSNLRADLTLPATGTFSASHHIAIDTLAPEAVLSAQQTGFTNISPLQLTAAFSESVAGFNLTDIECTNGTASNLSGGPAVYTFQVTPDEQGILGCTLAEGAVSDNAGNSNTAAAQFDIVYDTASPAIVKVDTEASDGTYTSGDTIDFRLLFSEVVVMDTSGGVPSLTLNSGGIAFYINGSGSDAVTLRYTIAPGESTERLNYTSSEAFVLNEAIIRDPAGNSAMTTLPEAELFSAEHNIAIIAGEPVVLSVEPAARAQNARRLPEVIYGNNLAEITSISFGSGISVHSFTIDSSTRITATISIDAYAATGARDVVLNGANGIKAELENGFSVIMRGDSNGDGQVGIADVLDVELIMLDLKPAAPGADANGDGLTNIADVITIELIMLGAIS